MILTGDSGRLPAARLGGIRPAWIVELLVGHVAMVENNLVSVSQARNRSGERSHHYTF